MQLVARVSVFVPRPPQAVFDYAVANENISQLLQKFGPIPGVSSAHIPPGQSLAAGVHREVAMTDGSKMHEELIAVQPPSAGQPGRHEYRWLHPPAPPFSLLIKGAHALWTFTAERDGTRVDWTYTFTLTTPVAYPPAALAIAIFRRWMDRALARLRDVG